LAQTPAARVELARAEDDGNLFTVFTFKDADGTQGYYLGLGTPNDIPGTVIVFDDVAETCIFLGETLAEAAKTMDDILALYGQGAGTTANFTARMGVGPMVLEKGIATAVVKNRFLAGKRLSFFYTSSRYTTETSLRKPAAKKLAAALAE
ncbi:MAG: hypothetical protein II102_03890, partial [Bacteroidales bacterium]|nr:hypothetical protein [Bacteroidales bacterium]